MDKSNKRKKIVVILSAFVFFIIAIHLGIFILLNVKGKDILKDYVRKQFSAEAEVESVSFRFPFTVVVKGFKCNDVEFKKADVSLGLFNPFSGNISLSKVYVDKLNFKVKFDKSKITISPFFVKEKVPVEVTSPEQSASVPEEVKATELPQKAKQKNISVKVGKLFINGASAQVMDLTKDKPVTFNLRNINIVLKHFIYPGLPKFYIEVNASLDKDEIKSENVISLKGWVDYAHRNMDIKFNINDADYMMFSDYYPPFWKPDNLGVKDAKLSLDSKINSLNNDLVIEAILALNKIDFLEGTQNDSRANSLRTMIAFFNDGSGKPVLPIKLRTKMDSFHIDLASLQSEFKGKMKLDIGTIVINILDKAKAKIAETTKGVKEATLDKAVDATKAAAETVIDKTKETTGTVADKTKEAAATVKDATFEKTKNTIESVVGIIDNVINYKKENKEVAPSAEKVPQQADSQPVPETAKQPETVTQPAQQETTQPEKQTEEAPLAQSQELQKTNTEEQSVNTSAQTNTQNETNASNTQANTQAQNQSQVQTQTQPVQ
ncbi:MAG: DUF748 domain-containing protein [Candidatus Omnitrophica bacterium]|nr:DUF748 domain-containing protein [Candidatus Omnitrophota bacterium]